MGTRSPGPAAVTSVPQQTHSILSPAHISAPAGCLPPSQRTGHHLLLAQCRPFGEQMFSGCWVTGQDRRRISRKPGKCALGLVALTRPPICLPCLAQISLIRAIGEWYDIFKKLMSHEYNDTHKRKTHTHTKCPKTLSTHF